MSDVVNARDEWKKLKKIVWLKIVGVWGGVLLVLFLFLLVFLAREVGAGGIVILGTLVFLTTTIQVGNYYIDRHHVQCLNPICQKRISVVIPWVCGHCDVHHYRSVKNKHGMLNPEGFLSKCVHTRGGC